MNEFTHFLTGYLIGRVAFKKKSDHFLCFFAAMAAILPDIDVFLYVVIPIEPFDHAVITHTIIGAVFLAVLFTAITWVIGSSFLKEIDVDFKGLIILALIAVGSHLILDIFTYRENIWTTDAHLYFWPIWNLSFHLNAFFHQSVYPNIYTIRILIEIIYTAILIIVLVFYGWFYKKQNLLESFFPGHWIKYISNAEAIDRSRKTANFVFIFNFILLILMAVGGIFSYLV